MRVYTRSFQGFVDARDADGRTIGDKPALDLTTDDVYLYCRRRENGEAISAERKRKANRECRWTDGTVRNLIGNLRAALKWAVSTGKIASNPLAGIKQPTARCRDETFAITAEEHAALMTTRSQPFRDLVVCLQATGARPSELRRATRVNCVEIGNTLAIVYKAKAKCRPGQRSHKTGRKGKDRTILFPPGSPALAVLRRLLAEAKTDEERLFKSDDHRRPNTLKGKWTEKQIGYRFQYLRERLGLRSDLSAYGYRHAFAVALVRAGTPFERIADLMGNSVKMIEDHYGHLAKQHDVLLADLVRVTSGTAAVPAQSKTPVSE
jgi:integrase